MNIPRATYTKDFQIDLLGHMAVDSVFFSKSMQAGFKHTDLDLPACQFIYAGLKNYFDKYKSLPQMTTLYTHIEWLVGQPGSVPIVLRPEEYESLAYVLQRIETIFKDKADSAFYIGHMADYITSMRLSQAEEKYQSAQSVRDTRSYITDVARINQEAARFNERPAIECMIENPNIPTLESIKPRIPTGLSKLNYYLGGGLSISHMGMITACPGVGKTTTLICFMDSAIMAGYRCLFITLELMGPRIKHRYQSIAGKIDARLFKQPVDRWPIDAAQRYVNFLDSRFKGYPAIVDLSNKPQTWLSIEAVIAEWIEMGKQAYGDDHKCKAVFIDWLDYIDPTGVPRTKENTGEHDVLKELVNILSMMARNHDVAIWTATQGNRAAYNSEIVRMDHSSGAFLKAAGLDVGLGLGLVSEESESVKDGMLTEDRQDAPACDRELIMNIYKNRDSTPNNHIRIYQGNTLKFYNSRSEALQEAQIVAAQTNFKPVITGVHADNNITTMGAAITH